MVKSVVALSTGKVGGGGIKGDDLPVRGDGRGVTILVGLVTVGVYRDASSGFRIAVMNKHVVESVVALSTGKVGGGGIKGDELSVRGDGRGVAILVGLATVGVYRHASGGFFTLV